VGWLHPVDLLMGEMVILGTFEFDIFSHIRVIRETVKVLCRDKKQDIRRRAAGQRLENV
jgi:hypothetical protein